MSTSANHSVESRNGVAYAGLNLDRLVWICQDNVASIKANLIRRLGLLFEDLLQ